MSFVAKICLVNKKSNDIDVGFNLAGIMPISQIHLIECDFFNLFVYALFAKLALKTINGPAAMSFHKKIGLPERATL